MSFFGIDGSLIETLTALCTMHTGLMPVSKHNYKIQSEFYTFHCSIIHANFFLQNKLGGNLCFLYFQCLLDRAGDWSFDVFSLDHSSNGRPLFYMILKLFQEHNLVKHFNLDIVKLMKFASECELIYFFV